MSWRAVQCLRCSSLFSCRTAQGIAGNQSWRVGGRGLRRLSVSAGLHGEDKVTHTGQVSDLEIAVKQAVIAFLCAEMGNR